MFGFSCISLLFFLAKMARGAMTKPEGSLLAFDSKESREAKWTGHHLPTQRKGATVQGTLSLHSTA
jgi:hypothetical protein